MHGSKNPGPPNPMSDVCVQIRRYSEERGGFSLRTGPRSPRPPLIPAANPPPTTLYRTAHCYIPAYNEREGGREGGVKRTQVLVKEGNSCQWEIF